MSHTEEILLMGDIVEGDSVLWAMRTFSGCSLGDKRRTSRLVSLGRQLATTGGGTISSSSRGDIAAAEAGYRFIRNADVEAAAIAEGGFEATVEMARESALVLAIQDTTTLSYSHSVTKQLGDLGGPKNQEGRGWFVHNTLLLDGDTGHTIGLVDQKRWKRPPNQRGSRHKRKETPYENKESFKWQAASKRLRKRMGVEKMQEVIEVCDREADIYEFIDYKLSQGERFVVRSSQDRSVVGETNRLWQTVGEQVPLGTYEVEIPQRGGQKASRFQKARKARKARTTKVTVRATESTLKPPRRPDRKLSEHDIWIVHVLEKDPPAGEDAIEWLLLTTERADSFASARRVVWFYEKRWRVEDYHKAWKSGCGVEDQRLQCPDNLERMAVILAFVAVRLLQLKELVESGSDEPCTTVLAPMAWKCLWLSLLKKGQQKPLPPEPPSIMWAYYGIAQLGGFLDTKRTGRVGWQTIWKGWARLADRTEAFELALVAVGSEM